MPVFKSVDLGFFKKWTSEMAYVLGFFCADGYVTHNKRGAHFWSIQITDKSLLEAIKKILASEHKISRRFIKKNKSTSYRLQIGSKEMCADLRVLGVSEKKTKSLALPNVPDKFFPDFVRGYFDGNGNVWIGHVHKERSLPLLTIRVVFTSCSGAFLKDLQAKLNSFDITHGALRREKNYHRLVYSVRGSLKLYGYMYNHKAHLSNGLFLERKKRIFESYKNKRQKQL